MERKKDHIRLGRTVLALLLSVVMTVAFIPAWVFAEGEDLQAGDDQLSGQEVTVTDEPADIDTDAPGDIDVPEVSDNEEVPDVPEVPDNEETPDIPEVTDGQAASEESGGDELVADNGTDEVVSPEAAGKVFSGLPAERVPSRVKATVDVPGSDELLMQYIGKKVQDTTGASAAGKRAQSRRNSLTEPELVIYDALVPQIKAIASGDEESAVLRVPVRDVFGDQLMFSAEELGYESILVENPDPTGEYDEWIPAEGIIEEFYGNFTCDTDSVLDALLVDMPYELYWFDKSEGALTEFSCDIGIFYGEGSEPDRLGFAEDDPELLFSLCVSKDYSADGNEGTTEVDTSKTGAASECVENAASIISQYENDTDYEKLVGYKNEICDATDYNYEAVDLDLPYGDPWQLIWVFDNDASTKVVCEGYSKAFQFLCDQTVFDSPEIECYQVSGVMGGGLGEGDHMWNILHMDDGENYLADITNCDDDGAGYPDALFIREPSDEAIGDYDYSFDCYGEMISYAYDGSTRSIYSEDELTLSDSPYDPEGGGGGDDEDFRFYEYRNGDDNATIYTDGDAVLRLDIPEGEALPEFDRISLLQVGAAVQGEGGQGFDWELIFEEGNEYSFDEETLEITIYGDKAAAALEYGYIDVFIGGDIEGPDGEYTNTWLAGGHFSYEEPYEDYRIDPERDMLPEWEDYIFKDGYAWIRNSMYPYGEDLHFDVTSVSSSDPEIVEISEEPSEYRYRAVSPGDADITVTYSVDGIAVPVVRVMKVHVRDSIYTADIWLPGNGSDNVLPGGSIDLAASAERGYKAHSEEDGNYDVWEPVDSDMFVWTVEEGEDAVSGDIVAGDDGTASLTIRTYDELMDDNGNADRDIRISLKIMEDENSEPLAYRDIWIHVRSYYVEITPGDAFSDLRHMEVGETRSITLQVREFSAAGTAAEGYDAGGSRPVSNVHFTWEYNTDCLEVTDSEGNHIGYDADSDEYIDSDNTTGTSCTFTVTRKGDWDDCLTVRAEWDEDGFIQTADREIRLDWKDYDIWFEDDGMPVFSDGDRTLVLNTDALGEELSENMVVDYVVRRENPDWDPEEDPEENRWEILENPSGGGQQIYTAAPDGRSIVLHGAALFDMLGEEGEIIITASIRLNSQSVYTMAEESLWVFVKEARADWEMEEDRDMLPGWTGSIQSSYRLELENTEHPYHEEEWYRVEEVTVESGAEYLDDWCVNDDGTLVRRFEGDDETSEDYWWDYRIRDIEDLPEDMSEAKVVLRVDVAENEWGIGSYTFELNICRDVFEVHIVSEGNKYTGLPGSTFSLKAEAKHEYLDEDNRYHNDRQGLGYIWSLDEKFSEIAELTPDENDPSRAVLRFFERPDREGWINDDVWVGVELTYAAEGESPAAVRSTEEVFRVMSWYTEIWPLELDRRLNKGSSITFEPQIRMFDIEYTGEPDERYEVVEPDDLMYEFHFDENALRITGPDGMEISSGEGCPPGEYQITRLESWGTDLHVEAFWEENHEFRDYRFDDLDYHLDFEPDWGEVYTDGVKEIKLNTGRLGEDWSDRFDITFTVGIGEWNDDTGSFDWEEIFTEGTEYTEDLSVPGVTLIGSALTDYIDQNVLVTYQLRAKGSDEILSEEECRFYVREVWEDNDLPDENVDLLPGWDYTINDRLAYHGGNAEVDGYDGEYIVQSVAYVNDPESAADGYTRIEARPFTDDEGAGHLEWKVVAEAMGTSVIRITYCDSEDDPEDPANLKTYDFNVHVVSDVYEVTIDSVDGVFEVFPGGSIDLRAYAVHKFIVSDDYGGWHQEESQEDMDYVWECEDDPVESLVQQDDPSRAVLTFREDAEDGAGAGVTVRIMVDGREVASGFDFYRASSEYAEILPPTIPSDMKIGEFVEIDMETLLKRQTGEDILIEGVEYNWYHDENNVLVEEVGEDGETSEIHNGQRSSASVIRITRLRGGYVRFALRAEWGMDKFKWHAYYLDPIDCSIRLDAPDDSDVTLDDGETGTLHFIAEGFDWKGITYVPALLIWNEDTEEFDEVTGLDEDDAVLTNTEDGFDLSIDTVALTARGIDRFNVAFRAFAGDRGVWIGMERPVQILKWEDPTFEWSDDFSEVTAERICSNVPDRTETETVSTTSAETRPATCEEGSETTYTAVFTNPVFGTQTKTIVNDDATDHSWGEPVYTWSADNSKVTAKRICANDAGHVEEETADATSSEVSAATCEEGSVTAFTAEFTNPAFPAASREVTNDDALGHDMGEWITDVEPTASANGHRYRECRREGCTYREEETIPKTHSHTMVRTPLKKATASAPGNIEYWKCTGCGKYFKDKDGRQEITQAQTVIPKVAAPTGKVTILNTVANSAKKTNDVIWDKSAVKGATGYEIQWRIRSPKASTWKSTKVGNTVRGVTNGLTIGGLYEIRVRPYKAATATGEAAYGAWSPSVYRYFFTTQKIRLASKSKGTFTMSWAKDANATSYQVLYTTNSNGSGAAQNIKTAGKTATSITVSDIKVNGKTQKLKSGTTYYVQVREVRSVGGINYIGNISIPVAVKVK